jgi:hypothetical protein
MSREPQVAPTPAVARPPQRDVRPVIYLVLDQLFAIGYVYVIASVIPNRLPTAAIHLWSIPVFTQVMAVGMMAVFWPRARSIGWWIAVVGGSLVLLSTFVLIIRVLVSAAFLAGVYGAFGQAAATFALIAIALVIEVVALLPIVQIKYLMTRAGRRVFGRS